MRPADEDERSRLIATLAAAPAEREDVRRMLYALGLVPIAESGALVCRRPGLELWFPVGPDAGEGGDVADASERADGTVGFAFDHAGPVGEIVLTGPAAYAMEASFHCRPDAYRSDAADAGFVAAGEAAAAMGGVTAPRAIVSVQPAERGVDGGGPAGRVRASVHGLDVPAVEEAVALLVDHCYDAANDPAHPCDIDVMASRVAPGYRHDPSSPVVRRAEAALRAIGREPQRVDGSRSALAERIQAAGVPCVRIGTGRDGTFDVAAVTAVVSVLVGEPV